jgi:hypothetical protein
MARLPKCPECDIAIDKTIEEHKIHSKKTYHINCFTRFEARKQHRADLIDYICKLYTIDAPNIIMLKQIKDYEETYKFTTKGMEMSLRFFHEIKGNSVDAKGIGIIPYVYDDAKKHYTEMTKIAQHASTVNFSNKEEIIYVTPPTQKIRKNFIDIEGITE